MNNKQNTGANHIVSGLYDDLTGLPGMTRFYELAEAGKKELLEQGRQPVFLFLNINGMKFYNSRFGFEEGDRLLRDFADLMRSCFGENCCGRAGQDHFVVFTAEDGLEDKLNDFFEKCAVMDDATPIPITVRVGICRNSFEDVGANIAYDRAKSACDKLRNSFVSRFKYFDERLRDEFRQKQYIIENIDKAIRNKWIKVYFQPIVRTVSGKVCDEEALARWLDPEKGLLSPAEFIPVLEESRLIYKLDLCIVEQVLEKIRLQAETGVHVSPQSINLSRSDFDCCDIVEEIRMRTDAAGISRDMLTIEITESVIGENREFMEQQIARFRDLGFHVWMDDFGSGYSSLDILSTVNFNLIKFDMHFMRNLEKGENERTVLAELIKMVTALGIDTVCEGVETKEQVEFLKLIGCSKIQGFYFGKPISIDDLLKKYAENKQIGYEDIREKEYYETVGRANLHEIGTVIRADDFPGRHIYGTIPMAVIEVNEEGIRFIRNNDSFKKLVFDKYEIDVSKYSVNFLNAQLQFSENFVRRIAMCIQNGNTVFINERLQDDSKAYCVFRRIAVNPITGITALAAAVISVTDADEGTTYEDIARALSADYFMLFYVNMENDTFIRYSSRAGVLDMSEVDKGTCFFENVLNNSKENMLPDDFMKFAEMFNKKSIIRGLETQGTYNFSYRRNDNGIPRYHNLKAMWISSRHIVIGISDIDAQMKHQEDMERMEHDRNSFRRVAALAGGFLCMFIVDPETGRYYETSANDVFKQYNFDDGGEDFFKQAHIDMEVSIAEEDRPMVRERLTRENVLRSIRESGIFILRYRSLLWGKPKPVTLKAALVEENGSEVLVVGVNMGD